MRRRLAAALAAVILLGGCTSMQNQETHQNVTETVLARADAWLADAGETGYTLGACTRKEDSWYAVEVDGGEMPDYRVFVRLTETGSEVRDDRVLDALSREMTGLAAETAPEEALCAAFVSFGSGMPEQVWPRTASLEQVAAAETLRTDWFLLLDDGPALADGAACLALEMAARGWVGTLHAAVVSADELARLSAAAPDRPTLTRTTGQGAWVRVRGEGMPGREELAGQILADLTGSAG